jgi:DNA-binding NarL/FixJ family response regulator
MLIATIEQALAGGAEMAPAIARQVKAHFDASAWTSKEALDDANPLHPDRVERQVLQWTCDGFLPHEIARDLRISTREVAQRVRTLYRKLHLDRRTSSLSLQLI